MKFLVSMLKGAAIGVAMIIPGVSGGTIAVLFNIYENLINAISNLKKDFKNSFLYLLPIILGMVLAFAAMYFPLKLALKHFPVQTISLFSGLMLGSIPMLFKQSLDNGFKKVDFIAGLITFVLVIGICFIPNMGNVDLSVNMPKYGYVLLFLIGILGSCALVIPGISGSMLLLIFGYYEPILDTISELTNNFTHSLAVLASVGLGIVFGFVVVAKLMNYLLTKYKRITYWAIVGFVIGSIPAIFLSYDYTDVSINAITIISSVIVFILGSIISFYLIKLSEKKTQNNTSIEENVSEN